MSEARRADFEVRTADWLGFDEALDAILSTARSLPSESLPLGECLGRALAEAVSARATLPPWDNSAMDGYAVRGADISNADPSAPVALTVTGVVHAGDVPGPPVGVGEAVRIMTGAPVPEGADSVVRVEDTDAEASPGTIRVMQSRDEGRNIRPAGADMRLGDRVLEPGQTVTPATVGVLSALGLNTASVVRSPSVAILATGDELRTSEQYDEVRAGAGVPESNGPMLAAAAAAASAIPLAMGIAPDEAGELRGRVEDAADADALVTIGGASMGEADLVKRVLDDLGFRQDFWRVRIRPGSPFGFGWLPRGDREQPVFGLPGNPTSAFVTFELFVRPFLLALGGHRHVLRRTVRCEAGETLKGPGDLTHFLRVSLDPSTAPARVRLSGPQGSGLVSTLARADGLAIVPEDATEIPQGDAVDVLLLDDGPACEPSRPLSAR